MAAKKLSTTDVPKHAYADFHGKGMQFFTVMQLCFQDKEWDAVFLNGVHAAISLTDAITVYRIGKRSASQSHQDAATLLRQAVPNTDGQKNAVRLAEILNWKHEVEYEPRRFTQPEASGFTKAVERFSEWAQKQLPLTS